MYLIPYVKAAQAVNRNIRFWASPWTPPTWMKTSSGTVNGTSCAMVGGTAFDGGCMQDNAANLTAFAQYFVKWVQAYAAQGITIETIAPQNEPNYAAGLPVVRCGRRRSTRSSSASISVPRFSTASLSTKIMLGTMSNGDNGTSEPDLMVVQAVMADATAKGFIKVIGLQWGMLDIYEGQSRRQPSNFMTGNLPDLGDRAQVRQLPLEPVGTIPTVQRPKPAPNDQAYGVESWGYIRDCDHRPGSPPTTPGTWCSTRSARGTIDPVARHWPQDALLTVNTATKTLIVTPAYYVFRHCSQFVRRRAKVVATSGGDALAFKNPDGSDRRRHVQLRVGLDLHGLHQGLEVLVLDAEQRLGDGLRPLARR